MSKIGGDGSIRNPGKGKVDIHWWKQSPESGRIYWKEAVEVELAGELLQVQVTVA